MRYNSDLMTTSTEARLTRRAFVGLAGALASVALLPPAPTLADAAPLQIWFIRHGESEINVPGNPRLTPDGGVSYPLTRKGVEQVRALATQLSGAPITKIYSSTHLRAIQTADAVAFEHTLTLSLAPEAVEIDFGLVPATQNGRGIYEELSRKWLIEKDLEARAWRGRKLRRRAAPLPALCAGSHEPTRAGLRHRRDRRAQRHPGIHGADAGDQCAVRLRPAAPAAEHGHHQDRAARQPAVVYRLGRRRQLRRIIRYHAAAAQGR